MSQFTYYVIGTLLALAFLFKVPALFRNRGDKLLRAVCFLLAVASLVFFSAAPPTLGLINNTIGVPNIAAPIVYAILTAFAGSCIVLVLYWRGGDPARTRRHARLCAATYGSVMVSLVALFLLGDAPTERLRDLDTYYATTPFIREMILLYLLAHTMAAVWMTALCWHWSRLVQGALRTGLRIIVVGYVLNLGYDALKFTAIGARWSGRNWDWLSTNAAYAIAPVSAALIGTGFLVPAISQRASAILWTWKRHRQLEPLWRALRPVITSQGIAPAPISGRMKWELHLTLREANIYDGLRTIAPYLDAQTGEIVLAEALAAGATEPEARLLADATVIATTLARHGCTAEPPDETWLIDTSTPRLTALAKALRSATVRGHRQAVALTESRTA